MFLENKNILFIAPQFYGYEKNIIAELKANGASVIFYTERENNWFYKFAVSRSKNALVRYQAKYYSSIYSKIKNSKIDYFFIIRGFLMPVEFVINLRSRFPNAILIMHQWDSIKNYDYRKYLDYFDEVFSFDPEDCKKYSVLKYLPNFYLPEYTVQSTKEILYDISFIGWAYEDRINIIQKIATQLAGKKFFIYCYLPVLTYFKNILKGIRLPGVKTQSLSLKNVYDVVEKSFSILDITDPNQSGYTYRSIDAMAGGKKLITTNSFLQFEKFYNANNICIIDRNNPEIDFLFFQTPFEKVNIEQYSLKNWIQKIFTHVSINSSSQQI